MTSRAKPPFRADVVGSLLRPASLLAARERRRKGELSADALRQLEDDAIREAVALQEGVGLEVATDGEFRRELWHMDFLAKFENAEMFDAGIKTRFHSTEGDIDFAPPGIRVVGKLARPKDGIFVKDFVFLQVDEVNFAYMCDPKLRAEVQSNIAEDPEQLAHRYAKLINDSIASRPKDMTVSVHMCRGNAYSAWMAEGGYEPVADVIFNELEVDGFFLEYDTPRAGDFRPLRFVPKGKMVVLGLVTTKHGRLETKDDLKRRIDEAAKIVPLEQLALSPQCGFASGAAGNKLSIEEEKAKLRLVVDTAAEIWG